jgi:hypothetical protein
MLEERIEIFKTCVVRTFIDVLVLALQRKAMLEVLHSLNIVMRIAAYHDTRRSPNLIWLDVGMLEYDIAANVRSTKHFKVKIFFHHLHTI